MSNIFIFHGDDLVSSRKAFLEQVELLEKQEFEIARFEGKSLTEEMLENLSLPISLFGQKNALVIENFLTLSKSKSLEKNLQKVASLDCPIVLWEGKEVSKTLSSALPKNTVLKSFKIPSFIFKFLETLAPNETKENLTGFENVVSQTDAGFVFIMLIRQMRNLLLAKDPSCLSEMPPWQKGKILNQAKKFEEQKLIEIYRRLLEIDFMQKTSGMPLDLKATLELLICDI